MAIFGIETEHSENAMKFYQSTCERLENKNMIKNPFSGSLRHFVCSGSKMVIVAEMTPVYPNVSIMGWFSLVLILIFLQRFSFWLLIPGLIGCSHFFWSPFFFSFMYKQGLRKQGYSGSVKRLKSEEIVQRFILKRGVW